MADELTLARNGPLMKSKALADLIQISYETTAESFLETLEDEDVDKETFTWCLQNHPMWCLVVLAAENDEELNEYKEELWLEYTGENTESFGKKLRQKGWKRVHKSTGGKAPNKAVKKAEVVEKKCVLCDSFIETEYGNNPAPLAQEGECCNDCNVTKVIPARVAWIKEDHERRVAEMEAQKAGLDA